MSAEKHNGRANSEMGYCLALCHYNYFIGLELVIHVENLLEKEKLMSVAPSFIQNATTLAE